MCQLVGGLCRFRSKKSGQSPQLQGSAGRFQESALYFLRNSVGVRPVAALNARLNGPID